MEHGAGRGSSVVGGIIWSMGQQCCGGNHMEHGAAVLWGESYGAWGRESSSVNNEACSTSRSQATFELQD